jgi:hypothetical protein
VQRFYREIEAVARLSHPNIVMTFEESGPNRVLGIGLPG